MKIGDKLLSPILIVHAWISKHILWEGKSWWLSGGPINIFLHGYNLLKPD